MVEKDAEGALNTDLIGRTILGLNYALFKKKTNLLKNVNLLQSKDIIDSFLNSLNLIYLMQTTQMFIIALPM